MGLALSGGGLRGVGHLGAIKALEEYGFRPTVISGCSAGAIVGALYAAGYSVDDMLAIMRGNDLFPVSSFRLRVSGMVDNRFLSQLFEKYLPGNSFESLKIPLHVSATDVLSGQTVYFSHGPLHEALLASSSVPFVFSPQRTSHNLLHDGGILNNLPVQPLIGRCDYRVGIHVNAPDRITPEQLTPTKTLDRIIHLAIGQSVAAEARKCDLFIEPPGMLRFSMFGKKELTAIYEYAYRYTAGLLATK